MGTTVAMELLILIYPVATVAAAICSDLAALEVAGFLELDRSTRTSWTFKQVILPPFL